LAYMNHAGTLRDTLLAYAEEVGSRRDN
jgi:hypothetical protein